MEIPTNHHGDIDEATEIIAAQAKEIEELQLVIVRLRDAHPTGNRPVIFEEKQA